MFLELIPAAGLVSGVLGAFSVYLAQARCRLADSAVPCCCPPLLIESNSVFLRRRSGSRRPSFVRVS